MSASTSTPDSVELSVVVVNFNSREYLRKCLRSIQETAKDLTHEIIVVDNRSKDGSAEMVRREFPDVCLIENRNNLGFTRGNNQGIRVSRGRFVHLLNNDTVVLPGAFQAMIKVMNDHAGAGLVGPRLLNGDGTLQQSFGKDMNFVNDFFRKYVTNLYEKRKNPIVGKFLDWRHSALREVAWVKGASMFFRRQALFDAGLMDESIFMFMEEIDLSVRVRELGWKILFTPEARIVHFGGVSTGTNSYQAKVEYHKSQLHFYKKHHGRWGVFFLKIYLYVRMARNIWWWSLKEKIDGGKSKLPGERVKFCREVLRHVREFE